MELDFGFTLQKADMVFQSRGLHDARGCENEKEISGLPIASKQSQ